MTVQYPAPLTTQTREIEGRIASLPREQVSQSGHLAQQTLDEHANRYQPSPFSMSVFPCVKVNLLSLAECTHGHINPDTSTHLSWARIPGWQQLSYDHKRRSFADQRDPGRSEKGGWRNVVHGEGKPKCECLKENMKSLDDNAVPSTGKIEKLSGFTLLKECNKCTWIPPFSS